MPPLSDSLLAAIMSLAADAIICVDATQRITFFNEGAVRVFGYEVSEMMGRQLTMLLPERYRGAHGGHITAFGASPVTARRMGERSLISGVRKNGEEFPAEAAIAHMTSERGVVFCVVLRDITEQRQAQELNERLLAQTEKAVNQRDELLALVSHDLRNPANAVKMLAGAILRSGEEHVSSVPPEILEYAAVMLTAATQMDALIQDLLDSTLLDAGRLRISPVRISVADLLSTAVDTLTPIARQKSITFTANVAPDLPAVYADPGRMTQVFSNLIGNSFKFTPEGGRVTVETSLADGFIAFVVRDTGVGIAGDDLQFVFDRFWQAKRMNRSGAGLGLAIARGIVLGHGGRISIESKQGIETIVRFTLPTKEFSEDASSPKSAA
jgi:PAS domain S-box-containing protein